MARRQMTVAEFGEAIGQTRQAAYRTVKRCGIPLQDGKLDYDVGLALYHSRTRARAKLNADAPGVGPSTTDPEPKVESGYTFDRARREKYEADLAELQLQKARGGLVDRRQVLDALATRIVQLRDSLLQLPNRFAHALTPEARQMLDAELRRILEQASRGE